MMTTQRHGWLLTLLAAMLLAGCSDDLQLSGGRDAEIRFNVDTWQVMGTRAVTFDSQSALQTKAHFMCHVYNDDTTTPYFTATTVDYDEEWTFHDGRHNWPSAGALDFFAYMPVNLPAYITEVTYAANNPQFTCASLPTMTASQASLEEFIYAFKADQTKDGGVNQPTPGAVALTFQHPFARLYFKLSENSSKNLTINSITIGSVKTGGSYSHTSGWTDQSGSADLVVTGVGNTPYLAVPYNYAASKEITVNATWDYWGETITDNISATLPAVNWQAGYSYTYNLTINKSSLIVDVNKFTEQW